MQLILSVQRKTYSTFWITTKSVLHKGRTSTHYPLRMSLPSLKRTRQSSVFRGLFNLGQCSRSRWLEGHSRVHLQLLYIQMQAKTKLAVRLANSSPGQMRRFPKLFAGGMLSGPCVVVSTQQAEDSEELPFLRSSSITLPSRKMNVKSFCRCRGNMSEEKQPL